MKVLLIQAEPPGDIQDFNFPMGYACLDSVLTKHGHEVEILFTVAYCLAEKDIARRAIESKAQVIGIGGMWPYLPRTEKIVKMLREVCPDAKIVIGGWMATYLPELVLSKTGADFCIAGEGEAALLQLLNSLEGKTDYSNIKGLTFVRDGKVTNNGFGEVMPFEDIPMPNWGKFPMEYYLRIGWYFNSFATGYDRVIGWATSRGCPGKCNFCTPGRALRYKKMPQLVAELHEIEDRFHPTFMYWMDNLTMGSKGYCKKFCEMLIQEKFKFRYFITGRVDIVDRELLQILKESGCACILYGLESANNDLLKFMNKNTTVEQAMESIRLTKEAGIGVNISAMFGQPGETIQDFHKTLKIILTSTDRKTPYSNNQGFYPLTTFPGSPIFHWAKENGYIKDDEDYYNQFFRDRWINYTQYPRGVVETVLNVASLMNTWNFHHKESQFLEDALYYMRAMSSSKTLGTWVLPKVVNFLKARPALQQEVKRALNNRPWIKRLTMKILGLDHAENHLHVKDEGTDKTTLAKTEPQIDPTWDHQRQVNTFIDLLLQEYFISGGNEKVQLSENSGRLAVLGKAFYDKQDYDEAIKYYKMGLELTPDDSAAWAALGWVYQHTARHEEAKKAFCEALRLDNTNQQALRGLGWASYHTGVFDEAIENFDKALVYIPQKEKDLVQETFRGRGWAHYNLKNFDKAIEDFDRAIQNTDSNHTAILEDLQNGRKLAFSAKPQI